MATRLRLRFIFYFMQDLLIIRQSNERIERRYQEDQKSQTRAPLHALRESHAVGLSGGEQVLSLLALLLQKYKY
jgi:hypothetical protein